MSANVLFSGDGWRMLTMAEATYLLEKRANSASLQGYATVNGVQGAIILPDNWVLPEGMTFKPKSTTGFNANVYDTMQWATMENAGAVFLPKYGARNGISITWTTSGFYWLSTIGNKIEIKNGSSISCGTLASFYGCFIRLVKETLSGYYFSISEEATITFASGNLQYQASTNSWKFADNQYSIAGDNNTKVSSTYNGWIDLFGWGTTGWSAKPYSISTNANDYGVSGQSAIGLMKFQDFGIYLCYLRDRGINPNKFTWVRNPTLQNGKITLYVSKRGSDTLGDGTAEYPYASLAMITNVGCAECNIMLDDGEWNEARMANNRAFNWWGNAKTKLFNFGYYLDKLHYLILEESGSLLSFGSAPTFAYNCIIFNSKSKFSGDFNSLVTNNCVCINCNLARDGSNGTHEKSIFINTYLSSNRNYAIAKNCIFINNPTFLGLKEAYNCNFTNNTIYPSLVISSNNINNEITSQTIQDYFNYLPQSIIDNPLTPIIDDWLKCDFTAKDGSANIGKGEKGTTIGLNQGYKMYADNSSNDVFKASNGAVLKNVAWNENLQGYTLVQKEKVSPLGGTFGAHTITLDSSASSENGYYVGLFIGIVGGKGYGQTRLITNYDGASRLCGVDRDWDIVPDSTSVYTISGTIVSAVKDLGKVIKVKRNWTFMDMTALSDGQWSQFLTHKTEDGEMFPTSSYQWEYSMDGNFWYQGSTADDLVSATDGENKVYDNTYGDCSADFDEENAKPVTMRYIRVSVHIGFNIGE